VDVDLNFMSQEEIKQRTLELLQDIDIVFEPNEIKIEAYTKKYVLKLIELLNNDSAYLDFNGQEALEVDETALDEIYYVEVGFKEKNIPIDEQGYTLMDESDVEGLQVQLYFTQKGVQYFNVDSWVDIDKRETIDICSVQNGIDSIAGKYKNIVTNDKIKIFGVELEYNFLTSGMSGELYLTPVLRFDTMSTVMMSSSADEQNQEFTYYDSIRVNAENGRIVE